MCNVFLSFLVGNCDVNLIFFCYFHLNWICRTAPRTMFKRSFHSKFLYTIMFVSLSNVKTIHYNMNNHIQNWISMVSLVWLVGWSADRLVSHICPCLHSCIQFVVIFLSLFTYLIEYVNRIEWKHSHLLHRFVTMCCVWRLNKTKQHPFWYCNQNIQLIYTRSHTHTYVRDEID